MSRNARGSLKKCEGQGSQGSWEFRGTVVTSCDGEADELPGPEMALADLRSWQIVAGFQGLGQTIPLSCRSDGLTFILRSVALTWFDV